MTGTPAIASSTTTSTRVQDDSTRADLHPVQVSHLAGQTQSGHECFAHHHDPVALFLAPSNR